MAKPLIYINPEIGLTREIVMNNFVSDNGKILPARTKEKYLKKYGFYDYIVNYYPDSQSIAETLVRIVHNIDERPKCKMCGGPVKFHNSTYFPKYCSYKC